MVDCDMPMIFSHIVRMVHDKGICGVSDVVDVLNDTDPSDADPAPEYPYYRKKVQDLLIAMVSSMSPLRTWDGREMPPSVHDLPIDRDDLGRFLFDNAILQTMSAGGRGSDDTEDDIRFQVCLKGH